MSTTITTETAQAEMREDIPRRLAAEGMPADPRDLAAWLASCWPHVEDKPIPGAGRERTERESREREATRRRELARKCSESAIKEREGTFGSSERPQLGMAY
jgi:hypothetical protein